MAVITKNTEVGMELPPVKKQVTLEKMRLYSGWTSRNVHTDWATAKAAGLPAPIAQGLLSNAYLVEMLSNSFGTSWFLGGRLSIAFARYVVPGDTITAKGVVREKVMEGDAVRFGLEVWCENGSGDKVTVGTASMVVH